MRLRGYPIVIIILAIASVWGLKVTYLCGVRVSAPSLDRQKELSREIYQVLSLPHVNILERFVEELGLSTKRLDPTGNVEWPDLDTVFILGNDKNKAAKGYFADEAFWRRAYAYAARSGARLVYIPPLHGGPDLNPLDIKLGPLTDKNVTVFSPHKLPLCQSVSRCELGRAFPIVSLSTPTVRLLYDNQGRVFGVIRKAGRGEIVVISAPQIADLYVIGHGDNGLLLANLALRHTGRHKPAKKLRHDVRLRKHSAVGFVFVDSKARELMLSAANKVKESWANEDRNRPLLTLWSIIKANPECIVLLQLLIVCVVFLLAGRKLTAHEIPVEPAPADSFLRGFEGICLRVPCERLLLPGCSRYFRTNLATRLGLKAEATKEELTKRINKLSPSYAKDYERLSSELQDISQREHDVSPKEFVNLMRRMDRILMGVSR